MSAMLDTYDMQMLDYSADHDIQMHQSSSDQWFPDESKMEEDGPTLFKEDNDIHLKADTYNEEKVDLTIEVDMEPLLDSHNPEYDMLDDEDIQGAEILDVEVYDASHAQSPAMFAVDTSQEDTFFSSFQSTDVGSANGALSAESHNSEQDVHFSPLRNIEAAAILETREESSHVIHEESTHVDAAPEPEHTAEAVTAVELPEPAAEFSGHGVELDAHTEHHGLDATDSALEHDKKEIEDEAVSARSELPTLETPHESQTDNLSTQLIPSEADIAAPVAVESYDETENEVVASQANSSGDPHEISDGVYIDPPPPVMLTMGSDDQFDYSLFSEPSTWSEVFSKESNKETHVLLSAFPTLYYETLAAVFEALRQEESVKTILSANVDSELVLEAVDLQLTMTEDNVYAQNIALHDLNVLHDVSGINGFLRMRLYTTAPRFVTRYQRLQDEVSRMNEEHPPEGEDPAIDQHSEDLAAHEQTHTDLGDSEAALPHEDAQDEAVSDEIDQAPLEEVETLAQEDNNSSHHNEDDAQPEPEQSPAKSATEQAIHDAESSVTELNELAASDVISHYSSRTTDLDHHGEAIDASASCGLPDDTAHPDSTDGDVVVETAETTLDDDIANGESSTSHSFDEDEYADGDYEDAEYEEDQEYSEEYQQRPEEYQDQSADLQGEPPTDYQDQNQSAEYQDQSTEHQDQSAENYDQPAEYQEQPEDYVDEQTEVQEALVYPELHGTQEQTDPKDVDPLTSAPDVTKDVQYSDIQELEDLSTLEQVSVINDEANSEGFEGDNNTDGDANYDDIAYTDNLQEFLSNDETVDFAQTTEDQSHPYEHNAGDQDKTLEEDPFDGEGDADASWDDGNEDLEQSKSNNSSVTLSSKASKRSFDEIDSDAEGYADEVSQHWTPPSSPGPKRSRIH